MNKKKIYLGIISTIFILTFLPLSPLNQPNLISNVRSSDASDINLDVSSLSIPYGTNVQEDKAYTFSGEFYDTTDLSREWSETAYLETQYIPDSDVWSNDSITLLDNTEIQNPSNSSISVSEGNLYQNGTLDALDDEPAIFNSSCETDAPSYDDYSLEGINAGGSMYNASFSFENGDIDSWYVYNQSGSGCYGEYLEYSYGHRDVIRLVDGSTSAQYQFQINIPESTGSVEFWLLSENQGSHYCSFYSGSGQEFLLQWYSNDMKVVDGTGYHQLIPMGTYQNNEWHHYRVDFDCSTHTASFYYDFDLKYTSTTWNHGWQSLTKLYFFGYTSHTPICELDALGLSWLDNYTVGDNHYGVYADMYALDGEYATFNSTEAYHYPATYNCDTLDDFTVIDAENCNASITNYFIGHRDVINLTDDGSSQVFLVSHFNEVQNNGTIEFWFATSDGNYAYFIPRFESNHYPFYVKTTAGDINCYDNDGTTSIHSKTSNQWYHLRYDFECTTGGYLGLNQYQGRIYVDGQLVYTVDNWYYDESGFAYFQFYTTTGNVNLYSVYIDALGYSWDSDYSIGQNDYWRYYQGTYDFEDTDTGSIPDGWTDLSGSDCYAEVVPFFDNHSKVLKLYDGSNVDYAGIRYDFDEQNDGIIEFYMNTNYTYRLSQFKFFNSDDDQLFSTGIYNYDLFLYNGSQNNLFTPTNDNWYHFSLNVSCATNEVGIIINGTFYGNYIFQNPSDSFDYLTITTYSGHADYYMCVDALSFSWDSNYEIGDNLKYNIYPTVELTFTTQLDIDLRDLYLYYSFNVSKTQTVNLSLYNFHTLQWDLINSSIPLDFYSNLFILNSSYYNSSGYIKINIIGVNETETWQDFQLYLDMLYVRNSYVVDFTTYVELQEFYDYFLFFNATAWYYTSIYTQMNFSIYDFENSEWILINSSYNDVGYFKSEYTEDTSDMYDLIDDMNDNQILFRFQAENKTNSFDLFLDKLEVEIHRKLLLSATKTFTLLGTWKYRFHIPEEDYSSSWVYFDVVLKEDNVEMISESNFLTNWEFVGGYDVDNIYQSDFSIDVWNLTDVSEENMIIDENDLNNYISEDAHFGAYYMSYVDIFDIGSLGDNDKPYGITWDGTYFYVLDTIDGYVYKYNSALDALVDSFDLGRISGTSITWDGTYFYITDFFNYVYKYNSALDTLVDTFDLNPITGGCIPYGINWDGSYFYITDFLGGYIYKFPTDFSSLIDTFDIGALSDNDNPFGIISDGTYFYVDDYYEDCVYKYPSDFSSLVDIFDIGALGGNDDVRGITWDGSYFYVLDYVDASVYKYDLDGYLTPKFNQSDDYIYMQTNETETISMYSDTTTSLSLQSGDKIEITFNTTSSSEINFILMNSDTELKDFILSEQGNINYNTRTVTLNVDGSYSINKLKFSSIFDDTDNLIVTNIYIYRYTESSTVYSYDVNPNGLRSIYLDYPINYSYSVYENDVLKDSGYIYTTFESQTLVYERIDQQIVYITYHDSNNEYLEFQHYQTYANFTYDGVVYDNQTITNDIMYVDVDTEIKFIIYDSFNTEIKETTKNAQTHIDIILSVYSLKIKNEATKNVSYTLSKGSVDKSGYMFPDEIVEFSIATGSYTLDYVNAEDDVERTETITLTGNKLFSIISIYHEIYFSLFGSDGIGLDTNSFQLYINGSRKDFGYNVITSDYIYVVVYDYFYQIAYASIFDASGIFVYNIYINLVSLKIKNEATENVNYTLVKGSYNDTGNILPEEIIEYNVVAGNYSFSFTNQEDWKTTSTSIYLVNDTIYIINSTYNDIYFSAYLINGLGINKDSVKFYINGSRKDFGFNTITTNYINITVLDFFNHTAYTNIINTEGLTEYSIYLNLFYLKITNKATKTVNYTLTKGSISDTGEILVDEIISYLFVSGTYDFSYTNAENSNTYSLSVNLNEDKTITINTTYYDVYFSAYLISGLGIDENLVKFYINGSRKNFGFNTLSSTYANLTILDFFNQTAYSSIVNTEGLTEYSIYINLKSLKIQNRATELVNYTLSKGSLTQSGSILSNEIIEYFFISGDYILKYTNHENIDTDTTTISLTQDVVYMINTTYFDVYFSVFNYDGLGLDGSLFRFYINGERKDFGFNTMSQDTNNLVVKDFFNATLKDETVNLADYSEYNLIVEVYTLFIINNYNRTIKITITRESSEITVEQIIPSRSGLEYRFLPNIKYSVYAYELNGTMLESESFTLDSQYKIIDFGFYQEKLPLIPEPFVQSNFMVLFIIFSVIIIISIVGLILAFKYKNKSSYEEKGIYSKDKIKSSKNGLSFDFRLIK